jgi:hypothetical protein
LTGGFGHMRHYTVNKIQHTVFENIEEVPKDFTFLRDWRDSHVGDWVLADDGCVIQILRKGKMVKPAGNNRTVHYVGTCTGTFVMSLKTKMDTSRRINIYSIGGGIERNDQVTQRRNLNSREELFVKYIAGGMDPKQAYIKSFPTNSPGYAGIRAGKLVKTQRVRTAMKEELKPLMKELDLDEKFVLEGIKYEATSADKADTRLKALFKLSDIMDLEDKNKTTITQLTGAAFQMISDSEFEEVKDRPKEIDNG